MIHTYLPTRFHFVVILVAVVLFKINLYLPLLVIVSIYLFLLFIFRRYNNRFENDLSSGRGMIFSPCNGRVRHIKENCINDSIDGSVTEIAINVSWWRQAGIFFPSYSTVEKMGVKHGKKNSKRYSTLLHLRGDDNRIVVLEIVHRFGLMAPKLKISDKDIGKRGINIGYIPFGGRILLYLAENYRILVKEGDDLLACETLIGEQGATQKGEDNE